MDHTLFLMRHGATTRDDGAPDRDRYLTDHGINQCHQAAKFLDGVTLYPQIIIPSGVRRTNQTADELVKTTDQLSNDQVRCDNRLYGAGTQTYLNVIREYGAEYNNIMIIGHNPTTYQLVIDLGGPGVRDHLKRGYPPATLAIFGVSDLKHDASFDLMHVYTP